MSRPLLVLLLALALVACGGEESPPRASLPSLTALPATLAPTFTALPTATRPPEPTATALPTATPPPAPTPDFLTNPPAREPSPGRTTNGKTYPPGAYEFIHSQFSVPAPPPYLPDEYVAALPGVAAERCPLTGEAAPADIATRRPINVRLDNSPQGRPQAGLDNADVVWEALAEGGVTRLTATFHCRTPGTLGPIRSARLVDLQLTPMLGAWLVHVGASQPVTDMIWAAPYADRSINEWAGDPAFYRIANAPVGWLLTYSNPDLLQRLIAGKADSALPAPLRGWLFSESAPPAASGSASRITIPYQAGTSSTVSYRYDPATGRYLRYQGQSAHTTQAGSHLAPDNVLVLFSVMTTTPIVEDSLGSRSQHFTLHGQGRALLFRDGQVWEARWLREGENVLIRPVDGSGQPLPLAVGQTWVQIVADELPVSYEP